jgi:hypothetical protein
LLTRFVLLTLLFVATQPECRRVTYDVTVTPKTGVAEVRETIERLLVADGMYDKEVDGNLRLVYEGTALADGKSMGDYRLDKGRARYPKPYAGVIWIAPTHVQPMQHKKDWGSYQDMIQR